MRIIVVGAGFVGITHAAVCSEYGHEVYAYDIDSEKLAAYESKQRERINHYVNETGLAEIIAENVGRSLFFVNQLVPVIEGTEAIFLCLPTPPKPNGSSDLSFYFKALEQLATVLASRKDQRRVLLINKSTVPVGTARQLEGFLHDRGVPNFGIASNPEFLPEGDAVEKSRRPERIVVGADREEDFSICRRAYSQFVNHVRIHYIETTPETAESIKYVSNTLLLTYISFWNGVGARIGETFPNVRMDDLKRGVTSDGRISTWGSYVSNGAGGSCFGKDIRSLIYQLKSHGQSADLLESVYEINEYQKSYLVDRAASEARFSFNQKSVALLGLAFKKKTNDIRDSSSLKVLETLLAKGVREIRAYDPLAIPEAKRYFDSNQNHLFEKISYHNTVAETLQGCECVFVSTDWEEFRGLSRSIKAHVRPGSLILDGRRMIPDFQQLVEAGYHYLAVGSPHLAPRA
jgi:UDPglucose 6-dehydrogenase